MCTSNSLAKQPSAVHVQVDAVDGTVLEQEGGRVDNLVHRGQPAGWGALDDGVEDGGGLPGPVRAVAHDPGMDRVDADGRELDCERVHEAGDAAIDRAD